YVKIVGMIDESFDTKFASEEPKPYEFRSKSAPKKLFVISAGVLMNLFLAWGIFWGANLFIGANYAKTTTVGFTPAGGAADSLGFREGDEILAVNGVETEYWEDVETQLFVETMGEPRRVTIKRDGATTTLELPSDLEKARAGDEVFLLPEGYRPTLAETTSGSPAEQAGFKPGDVVLAIDGEKIGSFMEMASIVKRSKGKELTFTTLRDGDTLALAATPSEEGTIGVYGGDQYAGEIERVSYGVFGSATKAFGDIYRVTDLTISMMGKVIAGDVAFGSAFGGPVKIAKFAAKSADSGVSNFLVFLAMLSLSLAIINILPFPALDGGHLIIILIEAGMRREIPVKVKIAIQNAGFFALLALMAFIIYADIASL
ncbi:MAG: RIP metalloprotease RseP, partial [Ignavibacteriales bacterium]|nr:RIP metalloprotease RseP [Ignavibacteriales bacterium]